MQKKMFFSVLVLWFFVVFCAAQSVPLFPVGASITETAEIASANGVNVTIAAVEFIDDSTYRSGAFPLSRVSILGQQDVQLSAKLPTLAHVELKNWFISNNVAAALPGQTSSFVARLVVHIQDRTNHDGFDSEQIERIGTDVARGLGVRVPSTYRRYAQYGRYATNRLGAHGRGNVQRDTQERTVFAYAYLEMDNLQQGQTFSSIKGSGFERTITFKNSQTFGKYGLMIENFEVQQLAEDLIANLVKPSVMNRTLRSVTHREGTLEEQDEIRRRMEEVERLEKKTRDVPIQERRP